MPHDSEEITNDYVVRSVQTAPLIGTLTHEFEAALLSLECALNLRRMTMMATNTAVAISTSRAEAKDAVSMMYRLVGQLVGPLVVPLGTLVVPLGILVVPLVVPLIGPLVVIS